MDSKSKERSRRRRAKKEEDAAEASDTSEVRIGDVATGDVLPRDKECDTVDVDGATAIANDGPGDGSKGIGSPQDQNMKDSK